MSFRVGIVGTGGIAHAHAGACDALDDVELCAVADVSAESAQRFAEAKGVPAHFGDLDEMLRSVQLDIAIICTWGVAHAEVGISIAESGAVRAILCEKPFTLTGDEAESFVAAARNHGVLIAEAFKFRHHLRHIEAKRRVDAGAIGELVTLRSTFCTGGGGASVASRTPEGNWRFNRAKGGGAVYDLACYNIHHARFILGAEPIRVFAHQRRGIEVDDATDILMVFPEDRTAHISTGFDTGYSEHVELCGTEGTIRMAQAWNCDGQSVTLECATPGNAETVTFEPTNQFAAQLRHLCECLECGASHRIPPEDSIRQMRVIDAVFRSLASGESVDL